LFNINRVTFYRWIKEGKLKAHKVGKRFKIPSSEIAGLLKSAGLCGHSFEEDRPEEKQGQDAGRKHRGPGSGKKQKLVLVIDRDQGMHEFLGACFTELGIGGTCRLKTFSSGIEAALELGKEDPDVVLIDITMPDLDGIELARKIRNVHEKAGILLMTRASIGMGNGNDFDVLVKPLNLGKLKGAVGKYLR
jgi:excisionase family DNA binding protein